jgi:hypothetical protein
LLEGISPITTQLNTGYSVALALPADDLAAFDEEWSTQRCCRFVPFESKPAFHGPVPACASGLLLFRFEGVALRPGLFVQVGRVGRIPGDVLAGLLISVAAQVPLCRMSRVEPM